MTEKPYYHDGDQEVLLLRSWVLRQMLRGAGWAAAVMTGLVGFYLVLRLISWFLPVNPNAALGAVDLLSRLG
jgi:Intrinsic membrane protein PufX